MEAFYSGTVGIKGKHWPHVRPALTKPCTASNIQLSHSGMQKAMQGMVRFQPCPLPGRAVISPSACLPHTRHPQPTSHARPQPHFALDHKKSPFRPRTFPRTSRHPRAAPHHDAHATSSTSPRTSATHFSTHFFTDSVPPEPLYTPSTTALPLTSSHTHSFAPTTIASHELAQPMAQRPLDTALTIHRTDSPFALFLIGHFRLA